MGQSYSPSIINFWLYPKVGFFYAGMSKRIYSDVISAFQRSLLTKRYHVFTGSSAGVNPPRVLLGCPSSHTNLWNSIRTNKHSTASRPKFPRMRSAITSNVTLFFLSYMEINQAECKIKRCARSFSKVFQYPEANRLNVYCMCIYIYFCTAILLEPESV